MAGGGPPNDCRSIGVSRPEVARVENEDQGVFGMSSCHSWYVCMYVCTYVMGIVFGMSVFPRWREAGGVTCTGNATNML